MTGRDTPEGTASPSRLVELQRTLYDSRNPTRRWLHRERLDRITAELRRAADVTPARRAIEVGPGGGPYVGALCDLFEEVVASDIEEEYLDHVRAEQSHRSNLTLLIDDIVDSKLEAASFDLVLCSEVIEHIPDPQSALEGIFRLLRPGGRMILSTPQSRSTVEILGRVAFWPGVIQVVRAIYREPVLPTGHISLLTRRRLARMIDAAGFEVADSALSGLYLPVLAEAGGERAMRIEKRLARRLAGGPLSGLLWTQYWIAERPG